MDEPVEDRVGDRRVLQVRVPLLDRDLAGDQRRASVVAIVEDLEQVTTHGVGERGEAEVVDDEEIRLGDLTQQRALVLSTGVQN